MILLIFLLVLFFIITGLLVLFVFSVFIPSISQSDKNEEINSYIFASDELKSTEENKSNLKDTGLRAVVKCNSSKDFSEKRFDYKGPEDCNLFNELFQSEFDCMYQCVGYGNCVAVCPQQAIQIVNGTAVVLDGCIGCGRCVDSCPKKVIELVPVAKLKQTIRCCALDDDTTCSSYKKIENIDSSKRKNFKFWQLCYSIFNRKNW